MSAFAIALLVAWCQPIVISFDSIAYVRQGEWLATILGLGHPLPHGSAELAPLALLPDLILRNGPLAATAAAARSPAYSLFLFTIAQHLSPHAVSFVQALVPAWLMSLLARDQHWSFQTTLAVIVVATTCTSLGQFAAFMMPDALTGALSLSLALLCFCRRSLARGEIVVVTVVAAFAVAAHRSNGLLLIVLTPLIAIMGFARRDFAGGGLCACALVFGLSSDAMAELTFSRLTGWPEARPPFLTARLIGDGPGLAYLQVRCQEQRALALCPYLGSITGRAEEFLWFPYTFRGVYLPADAALRYRLADGDMTFAINVARAYPVEVLRAALANWARQIVSVHTDEFDVDARRFMADVAPDAAVLRLLLGRYKRVPNCETFHIASASDFETAVLVIAIGLLIVAAVTRPTTTVGSSRSIVLFLLASCLVNALICGALSGVSGRYEDRMSWLVVVAAALEVHRKRRLSQLNTLHG